MAKVPIYIVRHAHAVARDAWAGPDRARPLTERGVKEARAIAHRFDAAPVGAPERKHGSRELRPTSLMSSPAERCVATLQPLAEACRLPILAADFISEGSDATELLVQLNKLAAAGGVPVLCSHGDVIWALVDLLESAGTRFSEPVEVRKGSILVLETHSGTVESARYIPPAKV
jgi:8-oxo-dGTP diphosphatase